MLDSIGCKNDLDAGDVMYTTDISTLQDESGMLRENRRELLTIGGGLNSDNELDDDNLIDYLFENPIAGEVPELKQNIALIIANESRMRELRYLRDDIARAGGMTKTFALEAARLIPTFTEPNGQFYTEEPSATRYKVSLEEVEMVITQDIKKSIAMLIKVLELNVKHVNNEGIFKIPSRDDFENADERLTLAYETFCKLEKLLQDSGLKYNGDKLFQTFEMAVQDIATAQKQTLTARVITPDILEELLYPGGLLLDKQTGNNGQKYFDLAMTAIGNQLDWFFDAKIKITDMLVQSFKKTHAGFVSPEDLEKMNKSFTIAGIEKKPITTSEALMVMTSLLTRKGPKEDTGTICEFVTNARQAINVEGCQVVFKEHVPRLLTLITLLRDLDLYLDTRPAVTNYTDNERISDGLHLIVDTAKQLSEDFNDLWLMIMYYQRAALRMRDGLIATMSLITSQVGETIEREGGILPQEWQELRSQFVVK